MNKGVLIFAHNNREIDYARMALVAGGLAKKNLKVPVSLATDQSTVDWMKESDIYDTSVEIFDKIIVIDRPPDDNKRRLHDKLSKTIVPFTNGNRGHAWDVTPYERTLLIDSDYLILSDTLGEYWDVDEDLLISGSYNDIIGNRVGYHDRYVSDTGVKLYWATNVMFTKNEKTKVFFDLIKHIKENYKIFADIFRFDSTQYRNDISFSIAKHILDGFETTNTDLPGILSTTDKDELNSVIENKLIFLVSPRFDENFVPVSISNRDVHIMNKRSFIRNYDSLMEML